MSWTLGQALAALVGGIVTVTVAVSVLTGVPVASYALNRNFALGTAAMLVGVVLIWYQQPEPDVEAETEADEESSA